ncbi:hypothetical protein WA016_02188 [Myxococcus stipitatus]
MLLGPLACKRSSSEDTPPPAKDTGPLGAASGGRETRTFSTFEYAVVSAAVERILPKDEDPGALDADVPVYIDRILTTPEMKPIRDDFLEGLAALERRSQRMFQKGFSTLTAAQQDELLTLFKDSKAGSGEAHFMELLTVLTLEGYLGDPSYGGNKGKVGWRLMGFDTVGTVAMAPPQDYDGPKCLRECGVHK